MRNDQGRAGRSNSTRKGAQRIKCEKEARAGGEAARARAKGRG